MRMEDLVSGHKILCNASIHVTWTSHNNALVTLDALEIMTMLEDMQRRMCTRRPQHYAIVTAKAVRPACSLCWPIYMPSGGTGCKTSSPVTCS
jgi:hypothetical protein